MFFAQKRGKPFGVPTGAHPLPWMGPDAPTTARKVGLLPRGGQYFLSKRKKVPKKASGTATTKTAHVAAHCGQALRYACAWLRASWPSAISGASRPSASLGGGLRPAVALRAVLVLGSLRSPAGKKASTAHFDGGARYVARSMVGQITHAIVRARNPPFSAVKMGGPFSLRCLSPLCSPAAGAKQTQPMRVGILHYNLEDFAAQKN